jgi:hypothetical protein
MGISHPTRAAREKGGVDLKVDQYIGESEVFILFPLLIFILFSAIRSVSA